MKYFLLKLNRWLLLFIIVFPPLLVQGIIGEIPSNGDILSEIFHGRILLVFIIYLISYLIYQCWLLSIISLANNSKRKKLFIYLCSAFVLIGIPLDIISVIYLMFDKGDMNPIIFLMLFFGVIGLVANFFIVYESANVQFAKAKDKSFSNYFVIFLLMYSFPFGVIFLQQEINQFVNPQGD